MPPTDPVVELTPEQITAGMDAALGVLEARGIPRSLVILGITSGSEDDDGTPYETHVGRTERQSTAVVLELVVDDLLREARFQALCLVSPDAVCPQCESPRFGTQHESRGHLRVAFFGECMDCGFRTADR